MKVGQKQRGFTIVEVMLVLGISSALLGALIFGTYRMIFDARFTDTVSSAASFLQSQYEEARSGVRPQCSKDSEIGRSNNLLLGKLIVFVNDAPGSVSGEDILDVGRNTDTIDVYYVLASNNEVSGHLASSTVELTNDTRLNPEITKYLSSLQLAKCNGETAKAAIKLEWNSRFIDVFNYANADGTPIFDNNSGNEVAPGFNALLIVRNPNGSDLHVYTFALGDAEESGDNLIDEIREAFTPSSSTPFYADKRAALLVENGDSRNFRTLGAICIDPGAGSTVVHGVRGIDAAFDAKTRTFGDLNAERKYSILQGDDGDGKCTM